VSELESREGLAAGAAPVAAPGAAAFVRLARPRQWTKNLLLFAALVFARKAHEPQALALAALAFASFCLASSSVYVINDLIDAERDRRHPVKRLRPIASGSVSRGAAGVVAALLTLAALLLALWIGPPFAATVAIYMGTTHFYSLVGKNVVILDTMLIAAGFVIRAVAGAVAIDVPYSSWFVLCTFFLATFLALCKRKAEIATHDERAPGARPVLQGYSPSSLDGLIGMSAASLLLSYALYVIDITEHAGARFHPLVLTFPFVMYGVFRYYLLVETHGAGETPEEVLLRDRPIQLCGLGFLAVALVALYAGA
jgi:4-hydroxybenzoate polyprenyltransferase